MKTVLKVLFLVNHDVVIYNFRLELVERLLKDGHNVCISSPYGERIDDLVQLGCEYHSVDISRHGTNIIKEFSLIRYYLKLLKKVKPDIVFTYTIKPNIYGGIACAKMRIPYVPNITGLGNAVEGGGIIQKVSVVLFVYAFRKAKKVFFQNTENMKFFVDHRIATGKHALLPGSGVNLDRFVSLPYPLIEPIEFAFISRIMKEKGIDEYLAAAELIKKKYPNTRFHVCGFCEQGYEHILTELQSQGVIEYHGMVRDIKSLLKYCHCTILPSYHEGTSNVMLETASSARPVITTRVPGCRETFEEGVTGFGCEVRDTQDLVRAIEMFISLPHEKKIAMGIAGRRKMEKEFNRQIVVDAYMQEIKSIFG